MRYLPVAAALAVAQVATAQQGGPVANSTRAGVYTAEQAEQGGEIYLMSCSSCHPAITHTGPAFVAKWDGRSLAALFQYIRNTMPKSEPGSLTESEYTRVLAYLLHLNGMPAGRSELTGDVETLKKIRNEFPTGRDSTSHR
jgi:hypothetical protein